MWSAGHHGPTQVLVDRLQPMLVKYKVAAWVDTPLWICFLRVSDWKKWPPLSALFPCVDIFLAMITTFSTLNLTTPVSAMLCQELVTWLKTLTNTRWSGDQLLLSKLTLCFFENEIIVQSKHFLKNNVNFVATSEKQLKLAHNYDNMYANTHVSPYTKFQFQDCLNKIRKCVCANTR